MESTNDILKIGDREFTSRLFVGTGKFSSNDLMLQSILASKSEMITVAIEEHDKPPKPVKEKKAKAADDTVAAEPIVEEEQPANAVVDENEPEEKPKKVIKRKAHKK